MYNYLYTDGIISQSVESDILLNESEFVTGKTVKATVRYIYNDEGTLTKKRIITADGEQVVSYTTAENESQMVKTEIGENSFVSTSKNDSFGRKEFDELQLGAWVLSRRFEYLDGAITDQHKRNGLVKSSATTELISKITLTGGRTLCYEYDKEERITKVTDSADGVSEYVYDALGQLVTETKNGQAVNTMTYDNYGNILSKNGISYSYDSVWKDKLTSVGGQAITYDAQGNPLNYRGHTLTWEKGRQLKSFDNIQYTYDANGIRTSKTVDSVRHDFCLDGGKILSETWGNNVLISLYDNEETVCGIVYNGTAYYFQKNLQGDVIAICDKAGETVARYTYDAWGVPTIADGSQAIATINPFRYRGYYYDSETNLYYLQSRYYDASVGRFVNGDEAEYIYQDGQNICINIFAYSENDPVNNMDPYGTIALLTCVIIGAIVGAVVGAVASKMIYGKVNGWWVIGGAVIGGVLGYFGGAFFGASGIKAGTLASKISMSRVRWVGKIGEKLSRLPKNTKHIVSLSKTAKYRIPDYLDKANKIIGDVKYVKKLSYTSQLKDFMLYAQKYGYTYVLKIRKTTKLSSTLKSLVDAGKIVLLYF